MDDADPDDPELGDALAGAAGVVVDVDESVPELVEASDLVVLDRLPWSVV